MDEDKSFKKFVVICYVIAFFFFICLVIVIAYGVPNFSNLDEQRIFCNDNGGMPIEPSRQTYNQMICLFDYNGTSIEYAADKITNEEWANYFNKSVGDYCFHCWNSFSCSSPHNEILRNKGVHC